jgi:hypothetical protein
MSDKQLLEQALEALDIVKIHFTQNRHVNEAITAIRARLEQPEQRTVAHWSDCALHSEPAYPAGECDCGGYTPEEPVSESLYKAAKDFYNATVAESKLVLTSYDATVRDAAQAAGERLRELLVTPPAAPVQEPVATANKLSGLNARANFLIANVKESIEFLDHNGAFATLDMLRKEIIDPLTDIGIGVCYATTPPAAQPAPPECQTEAEKRAYAFGWWRAMEASKTQRQWVGLTGEEVEQVWKRVQANDFHDCVQPFAKDIEAKLNEKNAAHVLPDVLTRDSGEHPEYIQGWNDCRESMK